MRKLPKEATLTGLQLRIITQLLSQPRIVIWNNILYSTKSRFCPVHGAKPAFVWGKTGYFTMELHSLLVFPLFGILFPSASNSVYIRVIQLLSVLPGRHYNEIIRLGDSLNYILFQTVDVLRPSALSTAWAQDTSSFTLKVSDWQAAY